MYFNLFLDKAEAPMEFKYVENTREDVGPKLDHYLNAAAVFKKHHYKDSISSQIDDLIKSLNRCKLDNTNDGDGDYCQMSFVAVAAPSLVGKTQLSFILEHRSLYFALSQVDSPIASNPQSIYLNFESLNRFIFKCSERDMEIISQYHQLDSLRSMKNYNEMVFKNISANNMKTNFSDQKFMILGLLLALVEDAENHYDNLHVNHQPAWMYYHAKRKTMTINPVSINTIRENLARFKNYFVFLDEYFENHNYVYIKNIVRAAGLTCFVANTNTDVANLISKNLANHSRDDRNTVWAHVITRLDLSSFTVLESVTQIIDDMEFIKENMNSTEGRLFRSFFDSCIQSHFQEFSPGMGEFIAFAFEKLREKKEKLREFKLIDCIDFIFKCAYDELIKRKTGIVASIEGQMANFALLSSIAYLNSDDKDESIFNMKSFLKYHLYHIANPLGPHEWLFKLLITQNEVTPLRTRILQDGRIDYIPWTEASYFRDEDFFSALVCMFGGLKGSAARIMLNSKFDSLSRVSLANFSNPKAKSNDGLDFEVLCSISIVDSSHHQLDGQKNFSLAGVNFSTFLKNTIENLSLNGSSHRPTKINLIINNEKSSDNFDLLKFLENYRIPFLNATNKSWPSYLTDLFPQSNSLGSVKLGTFERTANSDQVDGRFDIMQLNNNSHKTTVINGFIECKDYICSLTCKDVIDILGKTLQQKNAKFLFLFCNRVGGHHKNSISERDVQIKSLIEYLKIKKINLYRFDNKANSTFELVPFRPEAPINSAPKIVGFIFEFFVVNSHIENTALMNIFKKSETSVKKVKRSLK